MSANKKTLIDGDFQVGSGHFYVDVENNRVGLNQMNPTSSLDVNGNAYIATDMTIGSNVLVGSNVIAQKFTGSASGLTSIPADQISGVISVANGGTGTSTSTGTGDLVKSDTPTFTGTVTAGTFSGSGASLTNIPLDQVTGVLAVLNGGTGVTTTTGTGSVVYSESPTLTGTVVADGANFSSNISVSNVYAGYNTDTTSYLGRAAVGFSGITDEATFAHIDVNSTNNYALKQTATGGTHVNAATTKSVIFSINDSEQARINTTGVGIGTDNPSYKLDVHGTANVGALTCTTVSGDGSGLLNVPGFSWPTHANGVDIYHITGNVGIGTTTPGTTLEVAGTAGVAILKSAASAAISTYNFILNGPRPGTTSGGAIHFINGSTRTGDGDGSTYTIRNDSGKLRLGNASYDTLLEGNVGIGVMIPNSKLQVNGTVTASSFSGIQVGDVPTLNQNTTGSAATLTTARTIGGVSFNGGANITLPGVNTTGNQNTTGSAATLTTARTIGGVSFNGGANITPTTFGEASFSGDVAFDTDTLFVDVSANRVGIGTTNPTSKLNVQGTISTGRNLAREVGSVIAYSSQYQAARGAANVINGKKNYEIGNSGWITANAQRGNAYVVIDLGASYSVDRLVIYNQNEYSNSQREVKQFKLQGSTNNVDWVDVIVSDCGRSNAHEPNPGWSFRIPQNWDDDNEGSSYRYWKFIMETFHASDGYGGIMELELYETNQDVHSEVSTSSLVAQDVYSETGNFSRGVRIGKGYGGNSTGENNLLVEGSVTATTFSGALSGNADTAGSAATLTTARTIGGVSFNGSENITPTTFGAASFSGDVAFDTNTLFVDSVGNKVGIGKADPQYTLDVNGLASSKTSRVFEFTGGDNYARHFWICSFLDAPGYHTNQLIKINYSATYKRLTGTHSRNSIASGTVTFSDLWISSTSANISDVQYVTLQDQKNELYYGQGRLPKWYYVRFNNIGYLVLSMSISDSNSAGYYIKGNVDFLTRPTAESADRIFNGTVYKDSGVAQTEGFTAISDLYPTTGTDVDGWDSTMSSGSTAQTFREATEGTIFKYGNVGIGTNTPLTKLHVKGSGIMIEDNSTSGGVVVENHAAGTGNTFSYILNAPRPGTTSGGATHFINAAGRSDDGGVSAYTIRNDSGALVIGGNTYGTTTISGSGNIIRANGNSSTMLFGPNANYSASLLVGATGGGAHVQTTAGLVVTNGNLHLDAGAGMITFVNHYSGSGFVFSASNTAVTSDDRVKTGEKFIENALTTLKKLKPQTYIQSRRLNDETSDCAFSAGLIAQEVYYQCPELKHIVKVPDTAHVDLTKEFPDDPQVDPDYSDWGDQAAAVGYIELIPYTISAIKQLSNEGTRHKVRVSNVSFSNVLEYHGLVVSKNSDVYVSNVENDKRVYGVISDVKAETNDNEFLVNYRGDGKVWVINADNIQAGDYITTSNVSGYAMKQEEDDTLKNYTVAKSTIDCDFTQPMIDEKRVVQTNTMTSRWKRQSNVEVLESTYSNISEDVRYTETKVLYETLNGDNKISQEEYDLLSLESQNNYTQTIMTKYFYKCTRYLEYNPRDSKWIEESFSKTVDSLDENGQLIWENTGTQVPLYPIKYITSSGTETNLSDAVYTAALIDCSILGG